MTGLAKQQRGILSHLLACTAGSLLSFFFLAIDIFSICIYNFLALIGGWLRSVCKVTVHIHWLHCLIASSLINSILQLLAEGRNKCKSGPKSGRSALRSCTPTFTGFLFSVGVYILISFTMQLNGGEGCLGESCTKTGAVFDAAALSTLLQAKHHDKALPMDFGPEKDSLTVHRMGSVQKRSYKRAFRRALRTGSAWYRGQFFDLGTILTKVSSVLNQILQNRDCNIDHTSPWRHAIGCKLAM